MNDNPAPIDPNAAATAGALDALKRKQDNRAKWSKIGGGLVLIAIGIRGAVALFGSHDAMQCTDSEVTTDVRQLLDEGAAKMNSPVRVTTLDGVVQVSHDSSLSRCTARVGMSDQSSATVAYHVDRKEVRVDGAVQ